MDRRKVPVELAGHRLDGAVRALFEVSWGQARRWIERGKVYIDGEAQLDGELHVVLGATIEIHPDAPLPRGAETLRDDTVLHLDQHVVVVVKPAGVMSIPFEEGERGTLVEGVKRYLAQRLGGEAWSTRRRSALPPVHVVQRLDRGTSGVMVFARTTSAANRLRDQFRAHTVHRRYLALAHGHVSERTFRSHLLEDRGDGLRGSSEQAVGPEAKRRRGKDGQQTKGGKLAITHVKVLELFDRPVASLIECRLETGRTNQIRIHLSEAGHPLLGETRYLRDYQGEVLTAPRLMLHAGELGFTHPATGRELRFVVPTPADMEAVIRRLRS